jgi:hypothetical protein
MIVMIKVLENFSHLLFQILMNMYVIFQLEIMFLVLEMVWSSMIFGTNFMIVISSHLFVFRSSFPDLKFHPHA